MAVKGFDIQNDLKKLELELNIPPFLRDQVGFHEDDVFETQTIAKHRMYVWRGEGEYFLKQLNRKNSILLMLQK